MDDQFSKAIEQASANDALIVAIHTLAVEYEAKTITAERFAERVMGLLIKRFGVANPTSTGANGK